MTTNNLTTTTAKKYGRIAGLLYLLIITCGLFSEMFVRAALIVPGNATETAQNIASSLSLFRMGFASDIIMALCDLAIGVVLYILLRPTNKTLAIMALVLRLVQTAIIGMNLLNYFSVVILLDTPAYQASFGIEELYGRVMLFMDMHKYGYLISGVFFGFNCLVTGYLFYKSQFFPKALGIMLMLASLGYLANCYTNFLAPAYTQISDIILLITAVVSELTICIWLLIKGAKK